MCLLHNVILTFSRVQINIHFVWSMLYYFKLSVNLSQQQYYKELYFVHIWRTFLCNISFPHTQCETYLAFCICCAFLRNVSSSHDLPHLIFRTIWKASSAFPSHPLYFVFVAVFSSYQATSHQMKLISYSGQCKLLHLRCLAPFVGGFASNLMGLIWGGEKNTWILEKAQSWYYQLSVLIIICI